jgi:hypothetical protein
MKKRILTTLISICFLMAHSQNVKFIDDSTTIIFKNKEDTTKIITISFIAEYLYNKNDTLIITIKDSKEKSKVFSNSYAMPNDTIYKLFLGKEKDSIKLKVIRRDYAPDTMILAIQLSYNIGKVSPTKTHFIKIINDTKKEIKKEPPSEDKSLLEEIRNSVTSIKKQLESLKDKKDSTFLGNFYLKDDKIDSVYIKVDDGMITKIKIYIGNTGYYENEDAPISLNEFGANTNNLVNKEIKRNNAKNKKKGECEGCKIILEDVLWFNSYSYFLYQNGEKEIWLNKKSSFESKKLYIKEGINEVVNAKIFTDINGLSGQPNGILQTEISSRFLLHSKNKSNNWIFFAREFLPSLTFSKFDSKDENAKIDTNNRISRLEITQKAFVNLNLKLNLLKWVVKTNSFNLNIGTSFMGTKVLSEKDSTRNPNALHMGYYIEPSWKHLRTNYFSFEISIPIFLSVIEGVKELEIVDYKYGLILIPQFTVNYQPGKSGSLFFRFRHFDDINVSNRNFSQFQFGYSINFTDLFNK